jgi:uncharacterized protein
MNDSVKAVEPFVVMAKPVGPLCNLKCDYCYYLETEQYYDTPHSFRMSEAVLEEYIKQYIGTSPGPSIQFTWHGGEPTLAGLDFFRLAVELQRKYLPEGWTCWNNLQTNGILLDDEWCSFLAEHKFDVGLSIDGTQWLHDEYRKDRKGNGTYNLAAEAVRRLQSHGIQPDLLCTVTSSIAKEPLAVYSALRNLNTGWIQFIPIVRRTKEGQVTPDTVSGEDYGRFLCSVFDKWIVNDFGRLGVQIFAEALVVCMSGSASVCWMAPTCGRVLIVEHDGSVYSCDHFVTPEYKIGDISSSDLGTMVELPAQRKFGADKKDRLPAQCRSCPCLRFCNGACPKDRFATAENGDEGLNFLCEGYRMFFEHAEPRLEEAAKLMKQGAKPELIMSKFRADDNARWSGVGRNDPCPCGSGKKFKKCCGR